LKILTGNVLKQHEPATGGYMPLYTIYTGKLEDLTATQRISDFDSVKINCLKSLIEDVNKAKSKLIVTVSPIYLKFNDKLTPTIQLVKEICKQQNIKFVDNSQLPLFLSLPTIYADAYHLNNEGAQLFTNLIVKEISAE
jgi:lysophospholipase L1-like esterase